MTVPLPPPSGSSLRPSPWVRQPGSTWLRRCSRFLSDGSRASLGSWPPATSDDKLTAGVTDQGPCTRRGAGPFVFSEGAPRVRRQPGWHPRRLKRLHVPLAERQAVGDLVDARRPGQEGPQLGDRFSRRLRVVVLQRVGDARPGPNARGPSGGAPASNRQSGVGSRRCHRGRHTIRARHGSRRASRLGGVSCTVVIPVRGHSGPARRQPCDQRRSARDD